MDKIFQIGSFCFRMVCENEIPIPENFLLFEVSQEMNPEYTYHLFVKEKLDLPDKQIIARRPDLVVIENENGESRLIGSLGGTSFYAFYREMTDRDAVIQLSIQKTTDLLFDTVFTSLFALERQMIKKQSLILHCAYIEYKGQSILFSAPSETGKSTQADLWNRYRGSRTVNGDRALLRKIDNRWAACGWPVCGSSEICNLGETPIYAIIMLKQGKKNHVELLTPFQAFILLYEQITVNQWNKTFVQRAVSILEDLAGHVPVYQLTCDISEAAVECLEAALFPELCNETREEQSHEV